MEALQEAIGTGSLDQAEMLGRLISRVAGLEAAAAEGAAQRRALHNQLVELRGNVRPRPPGLGAGQGDESGGRCRSGCCVSAGAAAPLRHLTRLRRWVLGAERAAVLDICKCCVKPRKAERKNAPHFMPGLAQVVPVADGSESGPHT
jgi:hypothetical protein